MAIPLSIWSLLLLYQRVFQILSDAAEREKGVFKSHVNEEYSVLIE